MDSIAATTLVDWAKAFDDLMAFSPKKRRERGDIVVPLIKLVNLLHSGRLLDET